MVQVARTERIGRRTVEAALPEQTQYRVWDTELVGFGLKVSPGGAKTYVVWYRDGEGRRAQRREYKIGRHNEMAPAQAREAAADILARVRRGENPQALRQKARSDITVAELCEAYLEDGVATKKPSTIATDRVRINAHIVPLLGARPASAVTSADVGRFLKDVAAGKTAVVRKPTLKSLRSKGLKGRALAQVDRRKRTDSAARGGRGTATRTVGLLGGIFTFAVLQDIRSDNPVVGVPRFKDGESQRFLSSPELNRLMTAMTSAAEAGVNPSALTIIRLLALTGARKSEIAGLRWSEIDQNWKCLRLTDSKIGARIVPLGAAALQVIQHLPRGNSHLVFPSASNAE